MSPRDVVRQDADGTPQSREDGVAARAQEEEAEEQEVEEEDQEDAA